MKTLKAAGKLKGKKRAPLHFPIPPESADSGGITLGGINSFVVADTFRREALKLVENQARAGKSTFAVHPLSGTDRLAIVETYRDGQQVVTLLGPTGVIFLSSFEVDMIHQWSQK